MRTRTGIVLACSSLVALAAGCSERRVTADAAVPIDAAVLVDALPIADGGARDAGADAGRNDAGRDAAARVDAGTDAGRDAASSDAGHDAGSPDAAVLADAGGRVLACVPAVGGSELSSGMVLGANFWIGFRFQITSATTLIGVGLTIVPDAAGTMLAGIVRLTDGSDTPDTSDLTGSDVIATTLVSVAPAGGVAVLASASVSAPLPAGWYALEIGVGAGGATLTSGTVHSNSGAGGCTLPGSSFPFTIRQSDGMFILQAATPNLFVTVSP